MPSDLNKMMSELQRDSKDLDYKIKNVLDKYEALYREANRQFINERISSGSMKGLEDFYHMVQVIRRNRDILGSLLRGISNLRSLKEYRVIEEDIPEKPEKSEKHRKRKEKVEHTVEKSFSIPVESEVKITTEELINEGLNG